MPNALSYIKNVGKSVGYSTVKVIRDMNPVFSDFAETNGELVSDMYKSIKKLKKNSKQIPNMVMESQYGKFAKTYLENLTSDIKTGKFYNKERIEKYDSEAADKMMGMDDNDFNFEDMNDSIDSLDDMDSWDDDEISSNEMMDIVGEKASNAIASSMARSAEYIVEGTTQSNRAIYNRMNDIYGGLHSGMATINQNISKMIEFSGQTVVTHFENSKTFYEEITRLDQERNQYLKEILEGVKHLDAPEVSKTKYKEGTYDDLVSYNGVLNFEEYFKNVKKNIGNKTGGVGDMISMAVEQGMLNTFAASPLSFIMENMIKRMIPLSIEKATENLNKSLSGLVGNALLKLKDKGKDGGLWGVISDIFGIDTSLKTNIDTSQYEKGKVPFDGITRKSIVEVIPTYLSKILTAVSGKNETRFNYDTGKFVTIDQMKEEFNNLTKNSANRAASDIDWIVRDKTSGLKWDKKQQKQFEDDWEAIKEYMYKNQKLFNTRDKSLKGSSFGLKGGMASDVNVRLLQEILDGNPEMLRYADQMFKERTSQNRKMVDLQNSTSVNALFNGSVQEEKTSQVANTVKPVVAPANDSVLSELLGIHKELSYIRLYGTGGSGKGTRKGKKGPKGGPSPSFDKFVIPKPHIGNDKEYDKNHEEKTSGGNDIYSSDDISEEAQKILNSATSDNGVNSKKTGKKSFSEKMHEAATLSAKMSVLASSATELAKKPANFIVSVMDKADERLYDLIYGKKEDKDGNKSFSGKLLSGLEKIFNNFSDFMTDKILDPLSKKFNSLTDGLKNRFSKFASKLKSKIFGEEGNRTKAGKFVDDFKQGFRDIFGGVKQSFRDVGDWAGTSSKLNEQGVAKKERNERATQNIGGLSEALATFTNIGKDNKDDVNNIPTAATGLRRVNKTGLAVISEGEAVIPPDMNPFNIAKRKRNEKAIKDKLKKSIDGMDQYGEGTTSAGSGRKLSYQDRIDLLTNKAGSYSKEAENIRKKIANGTATEKDIERLKQLERNFKTAANLANKYINSEKGAKQDIGREDYEEGRTPFYQRVEDELINGAKSVFTSFKESMIGTDSKKEGEAFKNNAKKIIGQVKEYGGTMAAGGAVGAGVSVLTGAIGGPLLGAAIGAGVGLIKKSETVQKMLFGEQDENGEYSGNILSKKLANGIKKYMPDMGKGATVGGIVSALPFIPGGPVSGIIIGSALGFAKNNDTIQKAIFGENLEKKDAFKKKLQSVMPKMGAGALIGVLAGPFGLTGNLILGSALGFAADTNKFKDLVFGKEKDGKRQGGLLKKITDPVANFFKKSLVEVKNFLKNDILQPVKDAIDPIKKQFQIMGKTILKMITDHYKKKIGAPIERFLKEKIFNPISNFIKKRLSKLLNPLKAIISSPFKAVGAIGDRLRTRQIKKGQADYMTAAERIAFRKSKGTKKFGGNLRDEQGNIYKPKKNGYVMISPDGKKTKITDDQLPQDAKVIFGDKFAKSDEALANMSDEDVQAALTGVGALDGARKKVKQAELDSYNNIRDSIYEGDKVSTKTAKRALKRIRRYGIEEGMQKIKDDDTINENDKNALLNLISIEGAKMKQTKKEMYGNIENTAKQSADYLKKLGYDGNAIDDLLSSDAGVDKLKRMLEGELKGREKSGTHIEKTPAEQLTEDEQKRHEETVQFLQNLKDLLAKQVDITSDIYKQGLKPQEERYKHVAGVTDEDGTEHPELAEDKTISDKANDVMEAVHDKAQEIKSNISENINDAKEAHRQKVEEKKNDPKYQLIHGDNNTDWRKENRKKGNKEKPVVVSKDEIIAGIDTIEEDAVGGFGGDKDGKDNSIFNLFKGIGKNIKRIAGNVSARNLKDGIDTTNIDDKADSNSFLNKVKNKFKKGTTTVTQFVNGLPLKFVKDKNGDLVEDSSNSENKDTHKQLDEQQNTQKGILSGIQSIGGSVGGLFKKLFGKKDEKKGGLLSKLFGEDGIFGKIKSFFTGSGSFSLLGILKSAIPLGLVAFGLSGMLDNIASKITNGAYGDKDSNNGITWTDSNGERHVIQTDENGNPITDENGNYKTSDGQSVSKDENLETNKSEANTTIADRLKINFVRNTITGRKSLVGTVIKKNKITGPTVQKASNGIKNGLKKVASAADKEVMKGIVGSMSTRINKWTKAIRNNKLIRFFFRKNADKIADAVDSLGIKLIQLVHKNLPKVGKNVKALGSLAKQLSIPLNIAFAIADFTTGWQDAATILKIHKGSVTTKQKLLCGLLKSAKNNIPGIGIVGSFIPEQLVTNLFIDHLAGVFGIDVSELTKAREEYQNDVDKYNEEHGTNLSANEYSKQVEGNYTWTEKIANKVSSVKLNIKEHGLKNTIKDGIKNTGERIKNSKVGKAVSGVANKVKTGVNGIKEKASNLANKAKSGIKSGVTAVKNKAASAKDAVKAGAAAVKEKVIDPIKELNDYAKETVSATWKKIISGDPTQKDANLIINKDDELGDLKKIIYNTIRIGAIPTSLVVKLGKLINSKVIDPVVDGVKSIGSGVGTTVTSIFKKSQEGHFLEAMKDQSGRVKDSPIATPLSMVANGTVKVALAIPALITSLVSKLIEPVKKVINGVMTLDDASKKGKSSIMGKALEGHFLEAMKDQSGILNTGNGLVDGLSKFDNIVNKIGLAVPALVTSGAVKLVEQVKKIADGLITLHDASATSASSIMGKASQGHFLEAMKDQSGILNTGNGLVDGLSKFNNIGNKIGLAIPALVTSGVVTIKNKLSDFVDNISNGGTLSDSDEKIIELSRDGKINPFSKRYWSNHSNATGIAKGFNVFIEKMQKLFNLPFAIVSYINPVKLLKNAGDWILNKLGIDDSETDASSYGNNGSKAGSGSGLRRFIGRGTDATTAQQKENGTFISQVDERYKNRAFNISGDTQKQTLGDTGCAPAAAAMVINSTSQSNQVSMEDAAKSALRYKVKNDGVNASYFNDEFASHGMYTEYITSSNKQTRSDEIKNRLYSNKKVVLMGQDANNTSKENSPYGPNPHYIVANGISNDGKYIYVNDPESNRPNIKYDANKVLNSSQLGISANAAMGSRLSRISYKLSKLNGRGTLPGSSIAEQCWNYFKTQGFSDESTAGILGNLEAESGMDPTKLQSGKGPAAGICQMEKYKDYNSRWGTMAKLAESRGRDWTDLESQLDFMMQDMPQQFKLYTGKTYTYKNGTVTWWPEKMTLDQFKALKDIAKCTEIFMRVFERPSIPHLERRIASAKTYYNQFSGKYTPVDGSSSSSTETTSGSTERKGATAEILGAFTDLASAYGLGDSSSSDSSDSSGSTGTVQSADGNVSSNPDYAAKQKALVEKMYSVQGQLKYSQSQRNPDTGSGDCSSTVQWAYQNVLGVDPGSYTGAQRSDSDTYTVATSTSDESKLQLGDLLLKDGHVEMYSGNGKMIGHGGGKDGTTPGPTEKKLDTSGKYNLVRRWVGFKGSGSGLGPLGEYIGRGIEAGDDIPKQNPFNNALKHIRQDQFTSLLPIGYDKKQIKQDNVSIMQYNNNKLSNTEDVKRAETRRINEQQIPKQAKDSNASGTGNGTDSPTFIKFMNVILQLVSKLVTNTDQLSNINKLLVEYMTAKDSDNGSEQSKQNVILARQNLLNTMQNSSSGDNQELLRLIEATEKIARE